MEARLRREMPSSKIRTLEADAAKLPESEGEFDLIYNDVDKEQYPGAWELARVRIRPGGLYICDNVLWSGRVAELDPDDDYPAETEAIIRHNAMIYADPDFDTTIVPTRDGILVARRKPGS